MFELNARQTSRAAGGADGIVESVAPPLLKISFFHDSIWVLGVTCPASGPGGFLAGPKTNGYAKHK